MGNVREMFTLTQNKYSLKKVCELRVFPASTYQHKKATYFMALCCLIRGVRKSEKLIRSAKKAE